MSLWPPSVFHPTLSFPQPCAPKRFALIAQGKDGKLRKCTQSACGSQHLPLELEGTPQVDTPQWALSWRTQNHPNRSPVQASQYPTTPRRPRLQENGGSALGTTWKPGQRPSRAVLGRSGFSLEGVSAEISAVQLSRLLLLVSPGASNFCRRSRGGSSGLAARSAPAGGRLANRCQAHRPR